MKRMTNETDQRIAAYLEAHREEIIAALMRLCAIPSVDDGGPACSAGADAVLRETEALCRSAGIETERGASGLYLKMYGGAGDQTIGIFSHGDVVPAGTDWQVCEPYTPLRRDGWLYGRGVKDDKGGIVATVYAMRAIRELGLPCRAGLLGVVGTAEETGMRDLAAFVRDEPMPALSFVPDNRAPFTVGEKSRVKAWLASPPYLCDVLEMRGGEVENAVLDRVTVTLRYREALYEALSLLTAGKEAFSLTADGERITLTARGLTAHAARPEGSVNAGALACELLADCEALGHEERGVLATAALYLRDPYGGTLGIGREDTIFGKRTAVCGIIRTRGGQLFLTQDIRFEPSASREELETAFAEAVEGEDWLYRIESGSRGFYLGTDTPLSQALLAEYATLTGDSETRPNVSPGITYARLLKDAYSCGVACPLPGESLPELPEGHGGIHQPDESIGEEELLRGIRLLVHYLLTADEGLHA